MSSVTTLDVVNADTKCRALWMKAITVMANNLFIREGSLLRHLSVSEVARRLGVRPRVISDLFYQRELRDDLCPIVAGRRLIPEAYVSAIAEALRRTAPGSRPIEAESPAADVFRAIQTQAKDRE
jgi:hypothetical protein